MIEDWTVEQMLGYCRTWSASKRYQDQTVVWIMFPFTNRGCGKPGERKEQDGQLAVDDHAPHADK